MAKEIIRVDDIKRDFVVGDEVVHALRGVSFSISEGEFVTIMGTSGSGKSTLLNVLGCLDTPTEGEYYLDGVSVRTMGKNDRAMLRNRKIGFIFQSYNLLAKTTAVENVELPLMYNSAVSASASSMQTLKLEDYMAIADQAEYISAASPEVSSSGQVIYGANNSPSSMYGVNTSYLDIRKYTIAEGECFTDEDIKTSAKVCLIGQTVVENLFTNGEDPIGQTIRFDKIPFKVIGVLASKGDNTMGMDQDDLLIAPYTTVQKRILAITYIQSISASAISEDATDAAIESIETILRQQHKIGANDEDDFNVRSQKELITMMSSTTEMMTVLLACIAGISLFVGGIGIMNIMYVSVTERTREIGLRMSIGARGVDILMQFLIESILLSVTGGIIGVILGIGSAFAVKNIMAWPIDIEIYTIVLSFIVCTATGIFFGWYPAKKAAALDPIEALRYE